jgi:tetratricopeptide (TPR) repeat protein
LSTDSNTILHCLLAIEREPVNFNLYNELALLSDTDNFSRLISNFFSITSKNTLAGKFYNNLAILLTRQQKDLVSLEFYLKAIELEPENASFHRNLGLALQLLNRLPEALIYYLNACSLEPQNHFYHYSAGNIFEKLGRGKDALECYFESIRLNPANPDVYISLAGILVKQKKYDEAVKHYREAISLAPENTSFYTGLAAALQSAKRFKEAETCYLQLLELLPGNHLILGYLGAVLYAQENYPESLKYYQQALSIEPENSAYFNSIGLALLKLKKFQEAIIHFQKAINLEPDNPVYYFNIGFAYDYSNLVQEAINSFKSSIQLDPDFVEAHFTLAYPLLRHGYFSEGWKEYEWRLLKDEVKHQVYTKPAWDGSGLAGKTIYIHSEQGLGDTLQFCRYLPLVKSTGARVIFRCQRTLKNLLQNTEGLGEIIDKPRGLQYDFHIPLLSLPAVFNTTLENIPQNVPYIKADKTLTTLWLEKLKDIKGLKVGIVWAPKSDSKTYDLRSIPLSFFSQLSSLQGITLLSLQKGEVEIELAETPDIVNLSKDISSFSDTAAIIENLDLLISIDTSVTHLAGAMAKPVWTLLPYISDWRWLTDRDDSPWYPTMKLFRQTEEGNWLSVFENVKTELEKIIATLKN